MPRIEPLLCALSILAPVTPAVARQAPAPLGQPSLRIAHEFSELGAVIELRDGRLLVADSRDHLLYLVDPATGRVVQHGTKGQGPNEYQNSWGLVRGPGDTVLVYDPRNSKFLRIAPDGRLAGGIPITSAARQGGLAQPRGIDAEGRIYWERGVVDRDASGDFKRRATVDLVRWAPGTDKVDTMGVAADHALTMHEQKFHPFAEKDAWVVAPDGRVGLVVAAEYRLRWLGAAGRVLAEGPKLAHEPVPVTSRDRDAFRQERALRPAGGAQMQGPARTDGAPSPQARRQAEVAYPDELFPRVKPPFEENGAWRSPGGDIWVARTRAAGAASRQVDVLDPNGALKRQLRLPDGRRVVALEQGGIYLAREDEDGLQYLERYAWPAGLR